MPHQRTIVCLSGAGLSQESGIPTFRDKNGLWENHRFEDVASHEGWQRDKALVLRFYNERLKAVAAARPNKAHLALARLQQKFNVINITQNIDPLLELAGCQHVWHLHGEIMKKKCEWHNEIAVSQTGFDCDYKVASTTPFALGELCPRCQGQLRPDVVWFGEAVQMESMQIEVDGKAETLSLDDLCQEVKRYNGVFICVGTSAQVYPAASLIPYFARTPHKYIVDKDPIQVDGFTVLQGSAGEQLERLADRLLEE